MGCHSTSTPQAATAASYRGGLRSGDDDHLNTASPRQFRNDDELTMNQTSA